MPLALAPSNVMPTVANPPPLSTESSSAYVDPKAVAGGSATQKPYRGVLLPEPAGIIAQPPIMAELESLGARLKALSKPAAAPAAAAPPAAAASSTDGPWMSSYYSTFAGYAGEASRVQSTGRLPFGSDSKKMAL